jgi:hypothetical protein
MPSFESFGLFQPQYPSGRDMCVRNRLTIKGLADTVDYFPGGYGRLVRQLHFNISSNKRRKQPAEWAKPEMERNGLLSSIGSG